MEIREIQIIFSIFILSPIKMQVKAVTLYEESQVPPQIVPKFNAKIFQYY